MAKFYLTSHFRQFCNPSIILCFLVFILRPNMTETVHVIQKPSPYFDDRLIGPPKMIVIHQVDHNTKNSRNFSLHYYVHKNGTIEQHISEDYRAWNTGKSYWHGRYLMDDWSISIGLEKGIGKPHTKMISAIISLIRDIKSRHHKILNTDIVSFYDVATERNNLAIPAVPWSALARVGVGIMPQEEYDRVENIPSEAGEMILNAHIFLKEIGYFIYSQTATSSSPAFKSALKAFQAHFIPNHQTGNLDARTYANLLQVRDLYATEYAKEWQHRNQNLHYKSNLFVNTTFASNNFNQRLFGPPFMVVIHDTEGSFEDSLRILTDPIRYVSAHYLIDLSGVIYRLVNDNDRAWHAGGSYWHGFKDLNDVSIGIELVNTDSANNDYPDEQIMALINLLIDIRKRFYIPLHFIVSHEDIAPTRKSDPGRHFPWHKLVQYGLSLESTVQLPNETEIELSYDDYVANTRCMLKQIGYLIEPQQASAIDRETSDSLRHFQWRFAPTYTNWTLNEIDVAPYKKLMSTRDAYIKSYRENLRHF